MKRTIAAVLSVCLVIFFSVDSLVFTGTRPAAPYDGGLAEEPAQFAQYYISWMKARNWDLVKAATDSSLLNANTEKIFVTMADMIPQTEPTAIHLVASRTVRSTSKPERTDVTLEYLFPGKPLLAVVVMDRIHSSFVVKAAHITPLTQPLEQYYQFHFQGRDRTHYTVFAGVVFLMLLNAYALVRCIMVPDLRRKWLWIIFILVGWGSIEFNWTDAVFNFHLFYVRIPIVRLMLYAYQPFTLAASLPLGTIIFLIRLRALHRRRAAVLSRFE